MTFQKSVKPADVGASNRPRKHAHLAPRRPLANTARHFIQPRVASDFILLGDAALHVLRNLEARR